MVEYHDHQDIDLFWRRMNRPCAGHPVIRNLHNIEKSAIRLAMLKPYIIYYKFKIPGDKPQPAVKQYRVYAASIEEARRLATEYANYPNIDIVEIRPAEFPLA